MFIKQKKHNAKALGRLTEHYQWSWKLESQQSCCHEWFWRQTSSIYSSLLSQVKGQNLPLGGEKGSQKLVRQSL